MSSNPEIESSDVPQAPNLARVRCIVTAIADGSTNLETIAEETDISLRHVGYTVRAAQTLGLLDDHREPTPLGRALLATEQESDAEREVLKQSVEESAIMKVLAPRLLSGLPPTKRDLAERIEEVSGLSRATAAHRASDLLAWREQLLQQRLDLPLGAALDPGDAEEAAEERD
ncbi:MAG: hypothetical protein ABI193_09650 [Minicystis sp.]